MALLRRRPHRRRADSASSLPFVCRRRRGNEEPLAVWPRGHVPNRALGVIEAIEQTKVESRGSARAHRVIVLARYERGKRGSADPAPAPRSRSTSAPSFLPRRPTGFTGTPSARPARPSSAGEPGGALEEPAREGGKISPRFADVLALPASVLRQPDPDHQFVQTATRDAARPPKNISAVCRDTLACWLADTNLCLFRSGTCVCVWRPDDLLY